MEGPVMGGYHGNVIDLAVFRRIMLILVVVSASRKSALLPP